MQVILSYVMWLYNKLQRVLRFSMVGGGVALLGSILLLLMVQTGVDENEAFALKLGLDLVLLFMLSRFVVWREREVTRAAWLRFLVLRGSTVLGSYYLYVWLISQPLHVELFGVLRTVHVDYMTANVICIGLGLSVNYIISDKWVFQTGRRLSNSFRLARNIALVAGVSSLLLVLGGFYLLSLTALTVIAVVTLTMATFESVRSVYSYRAPEATKALKFPEPQASQERIAVIVPAYKEEAVLHATLVQLVRQTHNDFHIVVVTRHGDPEDTKGEALKAQAAFPDKISVLEYILPEGVTPGKAPQLNHGLKYLKGKGFTVVGVIDAEDHVAPELLVHVDTAFKESGADIVQGGVQLMNHDGPWFSVHNVVEYAQWFTGVVSFQSEVAKFFPLGGNTVLIRYDLLEAVGGWENHPTEDCALGVKLSVEYGVKVAAFYDPALTTQEETPATLSDLVKQRVRWYQGFFIELRKGLWRKLPSLRQRAMALYILCSPVYQAFSTLLLGVTVVSFFLMKAPVPLVLMMWSPLIPMVLQWVLKSITLYDFGKAYDRKIGIKSYASLVFLHPLYQLVLNIAGIRAVIREFRGNREWFKTPHSNLHRQTEDVPAPAANVPNLVMEEA